jgi:hypothetical protein
VILNRVSPTVAKTKHAFAIFKLAGVLKAEPGVQVLRNIITRHDAGIERLATRFGSHLLDKLLHDGATIFI